MTLNYSPILQTSQSMRRILDNDLSIHEQRGKILKQLWQETWDGYIQSRFGTNESKTDRHEDVYFGSPKHSHHYLDQELESMTDSDDVVFDPREVGMCRRKSLSNRNVWDRHLENKQIEDKVGVHAYRNAIEVRRRLGEEHDYLLEKCMVELDGCDVYWDGAVDGVELRASEREPMHHHGKTERCGIDKTFYSIIPPFQEPAESSLGTHPFISISKSHYGRLQVIPFPFSATLRFDDCHDMVVFNLKASDSVDDVRRLIDLNLSRPDIVSRRRLRNKLRSLDGRKIFVNGKTCRLEIVHGQNTCCLVDSPTCKCVGVSRGFTCRLVMGSDPWRFSPSCLLHRRASNVITLQLSNKEEANEYLDAICSQVDDVRVAVLEQALATLRKETYMHFQERQLSLPFEFHIQVYHDFELDHHQLNEFLSGYRRECPIYDMLISDQSNAVYDLLHVIGILKDYQPHKFLWWAFWYDVHRSNYAIWPYRPQMAVAIDPLKPDSVAFLWDHIASPKRLLDILSSKGVTDDSLIAHLPIQQLLNRIHIMKGRSAV